MSKRKVAKALSILRLVRHDVNLYIQEVSKAKNSLTSAEYSVLEQKLLKI